METRIHVVSPDDGWVLQRTADLWNFPNKTRGAEPDCAADVNFYINYALFREKTATIDVAWFTHCPDDPALWNTVALACDWCVAMCQKTAERLPKGTRGVTIAGGAPDPQFHKGPLILGVVGREYPGNRKGTDALAEIRRLPGVEVRFTGGRLPFARLPEFYKSIDYLLVLSRNEGGPLPVLEALAMGKPVIAPDVGWCWEHPVIRYHTIDELKGILSKLVIPRDLCEKQSAMLMGVFERLISARRDARGYSSDAACPANMDGGPASIVSA